MKGSILRQGASWKVNYYFKGGRITKCFKNLEDAEIFRAGLRVKEREGVLDPRDYKADNPLGFENMVEKFLHAKRLLKSVRKYDQKLRFAVDAYGNKNIKAIAFTDIDSLLLSLQERGLRMVVYSVYWGLLWAFLPHNCLNKSRTNLSEVLIKNK